MKKIKKILLAFAPLAAIAVATPIVLTACSSTSNTTTPGGDNDGNDNSNDGNGGSGSVDPKPTFSADNTNSDSFALESSSDAQQILEKYKAAKGEAAASKVLTDELANFPKKESKTLAEDVLKMWSNNNWFTITKSAKDAKVKETFISNLNVSKVVVETEGKETKATINAEYKTAFEDSNGKLYESTQLLKAEKVNVDATTKIDIPKEIPTDGYKIDGEVQSLPSTSLVEGIADPKTNLETILKAPKVSLDAKEIFTAYIKNHNIEHADEPATPMAKNPIWDKAKIDADKSLTYTNDKEIVMQLKDKGDSNWGNCVTTTTYANVLKTMKDTKYVNKIKNLITANDYENPTLEYGNEIKNTNDSDMDIKITFTKKASSQGDDTKPTLTFKIKGFKKSA